MAQTSEPSGKVIVVDWGTTSLRAALVSPAGKTIEFVENGCGIQFIADRKFEPELLKTVGPWLKTHGKLPVIASGMITSRNGWVEVPYISCPARVVDLAEGTVRRRLSNGSELFLLPGLTDRSRRPFPDVMRGEETQIVGFGLQRPATIVLPGTHSKWAKVETGQIAKFQTFVTGEIFALLSQHSFIAKTAGEASATANWPAFERGVNVAKNMLDADAAFLTQLFSARTGMLANELGPEDIRDFISGVLIGNEFREAQCCGWTEAGQKIGIVGNDGLNERYSRAANLFELFPTEGGDQAVVAGALEIYSALRQSAVEVA
ncbi:2-dehydro-3-deoxygalactonokinase [Roseibium sp. SCP14]|uniref:2-dehydro-3-deoxygalactonokinase n=1 Tax=Roseibium sp. SCP14 TaxID=3141375 RepID=UPI00333CC208